MLSVDNGVAGKRRGKAAKWLALGGEGARPVDEALATVLASLPDLTAIAFGDMANYLDDEARDAARASIHCSCETTLLVNGMGTSN